MNASLNIPPAHPLQDRDERRTILTTSPKRISVETWTEIFELYLSESSWDIASPESEMTPWTISHVCREWRIMVFAAPSLWSTIRFDCAEYSGDSEPARTRAIAHHQRLLQQLEISKQLPLDIVVSNYSVDYSEPPCALWLTLIPHLHRSRTLSIEDLTDRLYRSARYYLPPSTEFPFLRQLGWRTHADSAQDSPDTPIVFDLFRYVPRLQHCTLTGDASGCAGYIPFDQLNVVELKGMRAVDIGRILAKLSNAEILRLQATGSSVVEDSSARRNDASMHYTFPKLKQLALGKDVIKIAGLTASNLHRLVILKPSVGMSWISNLLLTSSFNLTELIIEESICISASEWLSCLRDIHNLTLVDIHFLQERMELVYDLIGLLSSDSSGPDDKPACPSLQRLYLTVDEGSITAVSYISKMSKC